MTISILLIIIKLSREGNRGGQKGKNEKEKTIYSYHRRRRRWILIGTALELKGVILREKPYKNFLKIQEKL